MKSVLIFLSVLSVHLYGATLRYFLSGVDTSHVAKTVAMQKNASLASQSSNVLTNGWMLNGSVSQAKLRDTSKEDAEYAVSIEKNIFLFDAKSYIDMLALSLKEQQELEMNRIKNVVFSHYVNACAYQEKIELFTQMQKRAQKINMLIKEGVLGGEFALSALLQSEILAQKLHLRIDEYKNKYNEYLQNLSIYTQNKKTEEPLCRDLFLTSENEETLLADSRLYSALDLGIEASAALHRFYASPVTNNITVGIGHEKEIDLSRARLYLQIPLSLGEKLHSQREASKAYELSNREKFLQTKDEIKTKIEIYKSYQKRARNSLSVLENEVLQKAYKSIELLKEKFLAAQGSYLEYLDAQKVLFELLEKKIDMKREIFLAKMRLYHLLGIDPTKDIQ